MKTLTNAWFGLSDVVAWTLIVVCVLAAVGSPFAIPAYLQSRGESISMLALAAISAAYLLTALGAYVLTRRRLVGLALVCTPILVLLAVGAVPAALLAAGVTILVFGTPFLLAYIELRDRQPKVQET